MAKKKFVKGSEEWQMFMDFWSLCQEFWEPEDNDEWWTLVIKSAEDFSKKYGNKGLARVLAVAFIGYLEEKAKGTI